MKLLEKLTMNKKQELKNEAICETCNKILDLKEGYICDDCLSENDDG